MKKKNTGPLNQSPKLVYEGLQLTYVEVAPGAQLLSGSITTKNVIDPGTVTVEDYKYGFSNDGGLTDTGFDVNF